MKRVPKLGHEKWETVRIYAEDEVLAGIQDAQRKLAAENPDRIVTVGGNCMVSPALFDYLHGKYENVGIVWIYAHPDVSTLNVATPTLTPWYLAAFWNRVHRNSFRGCGIRCLSRAMSCMSGYSSSTTIRKFA